VLYTGAVQAFCDPFGGCCIWSVMVGDVIRKTRCGSPDLVGVVLIQVHTVYVRQASRASSSSVQ
jgi:hypothetical protein